MDYRRIGCRTCSRVLVRTLLVLAVGDFRAFKSMGFFQIVDECDMDKALAFVTYQHSNELVWDKAESTSWFQYVWSSEIVCDMHGYERAGNSRDAFGARFVIRQIAPAWAFMRSSSDTLYVSVAQDCVADYLRSRGGSDSGPHNAIIGGDIYQTDLGDEPDRSLDDFEPAVVSDSQSSLRPDFDWVGKVCTEAGIDPPGDLAASSRLLLRSWVVVLVWMRWRTGSTSCWT